MKNSNGFTLIELIIYVAIISIIMAGMIPFAWNMIEGGAKSAMEQEISSQGRYVSERIKYEIRRASGITAVAATSISLTNFSPDTTTVIDLSGGKMRINKNGTGAINLNSNDTTITCTTCFVDLRNGTATKQIQFVFTIDDNATSVRQEFQAPPLTFESSAELRSN